MRLKHQRVSYNHNNQVALLVCKHIHTVKMQKRTCQGLQMSIKKENNSQRRETLRILTLI